MFAKKSPRGLFFVGVLVWLADRRDSESWMCQNLPRGGLPDVNFLLKQPAGRPFGQFKRGVGLSSPKASSREVSLLAVGEFCRLARGNCPFSFWFVGFYKFVGEFMCRIKENYPFQLVRGTICNFFGEFQHFASSHSPIASSRKKTSALVGQSPRDQTYNLPMPRHTKSESASSLDNSRGCRLIIIQSSISFKIFHCLLEKCR